MKCDVNQTILISVTDVNQRISNMKVNLKTLGAVLPDIIQLILLPLSPSLFFSLSFVHVHKQDTIS